MPISDGISSLRASAQCIGVLRQEDAAAKTPDAKPGIILIRNRACHGGISLSDPASDDGADGRRQHPRGRPPSVVATAWRCGGNSRENRRKDRRDRRPPPENPWTIRQAISEAKGAAAGTTGRGDRQK